MTSVLATFPFVRRHAMPIYSPLSPGPLSPTPDSPEAGATAAPVLRRAGFPGVAVTSSSPDSSESPPPSPKSGPMRSSGPAAPPVLTRWRSRARDRRCSTCAPNGTMGARRRGSSTHAESEPGRPVGTHALLVAHRQGAPAPAGARTISLATQGASCAAELVPSALICAPGAAPPASVCRVHRAYTNRA